MLMTLVDLGTAQIGVREAVWPRAGGKQSSADALAPAAPRGCGGAHRLVVGLVLRLPMDQFVSFVLCILAWMVVDQAVLGTARAALLAYEKLHWDAVIACIGIVTRLVGLLIAGVPRL